MKALQHPLSINSPIHLSIHPTIRLLGPHPASLTCVEEPFAQVLLQLLNLLVAFNGSGNTALFSSGGVFDLTSAWLTAVWNDGLQLRVQGFAGGTLAYDHTYTLNAVTPTLLALNYLAVDEVSFISTGGINHGYGGSGTQFVMDDLTVTIPEPGVANLAWIASAGLWLCSRCRHKWQLSLVTAPGFDCAELLRRQAIQASHAPSGNDVPAAIWALPKRLQFLSVTGMAT